MKKDGVMGWVDGRENTDEKSMANNNKMSGSSPLEGGGDAEWTKFATNGMSIINSKITMKGAEQACNPGSPAAGGNQNAMNALKFPTCTLAKRKALCKTAGCCVLAWQCQ